MRYSDENFRDFKGIYYFKESHKKFETQLIRMYINIIKKNTKKFQSKNIHSWNSRNGSMK